MGRSSGLSFKYCDCCGNQFIQSTVGAYRIPSKGKTLKFCSYACFRKIQKLKEAKKLEDIDKIVSEAAKRQQELRESIQN